ncbi:MAG: MBL fold metallo-hydrolase [Prevotella sp.]|nr:MBL fold metallo-hydrolase [Prevotella sp.]
MEWSVLSDNRTNDRKLETEHGLSILLETGKHRILLDTGASDVFIRNAEKMGIDLSMVDYVFISHGHSDHAGGFRHFMGINDKAKAIVSPYAISGKFYSKRNRRQTESEAKCLHSITAQWPENLRDRLLMVDKTCVITEGVHVLAQIPQIHPMPHGNQHLLVQDGNGDYMNDDFRHELALYTEGLLFTGCAHSGLENILFACPWPVHTVVGGFHLLDGQESKEELTKLAQRLKDNYPNTQFYTSHCTGDSVFEVMKSIMGEQLHPFCCGTNMNMQ